MGSYNTYIAIDLKSFYASVECRERGLDPLGTHLVVADARRTEKTICLAVSPSLKAYGVGGRARLFEVVQRVREINAERLATLRRRNPPPKQPKPKKQLEQSTSSVMGPSGPTDSSFLSEDITGTVLESYHPFEGALFRGASFLDEAVRTDPWLELDYLIAKPRMALYMDYSTRIYEIYLRYFAPEDIHVYSIDEVLIDATGYLRSYGMDGQRLASQVIRDILDSTGITATAGIGTNLYLAKVAMDILAKHEPPDAHGVRMAFLDEERYKQRLWSHRPLTDFWRIGRGYARKLEAHGLYTMGDVARCSLGARDDPQNEDLLFRLFGKNAELLIDHAWGYEPTTMAEIKAYKPQINSTMTGQVLQRPYGFREARLVVWEMADQLALDLTEARKETDRLTLTVSYDRESLADPKIREAYEGPIVQDRFGRSLPKHAHGTRALGETTASSHDITEAVLSLFDDLVDRRLLVRKISITADGLLSQEQAAERRRCRQRSLFEEMDPPSKDATLERERNIQEAMVGIRQRFGKNAILKAPSLQEGATAQQRNNQIGGHSA